MFVDEFLSLLRLDLFPRDNTLPKFLYEIKIIMKQLGLSYNSTHACYNGCVLFRGKLKGTTSFPKCKKSKFIEGSNTIPCKVLRHFPLIPRLKPMYKCPTLVDLMISHNANKSINGLVRLVCDTKAWKHIDMTWPDFATNPCNTRLGLTFDGVNPYVDLSTNHSTWPILLLNYKFASLVDNKKDFL
jgi:hypothetical protein